MSQPLPPQNPAEPAPENPPNPAPANPPSGATPAPPPPPSPAPTPRGGGGFDAESAFAGLQQTLAGLPEKLVNAVREAAPPPVTKPEPVAQQQAKSKKSFGDWWFNG